MKIVRHGGSVTLPKGPLSAEIHEAILQLDPNDKTLWTAKGEPSVKAIENVIGKNIDEKDRDAVWKVCLDCQAAREKVKKDKATAQAKARKEAGK